jgi:hypothetical protein
MHAELVVPGLFAAGVGTRFTALELLLARGRSRAAPAQRLEGWLQEAFDLGDGPFPAGALTLLGCGGDPGGASWARADPVHLRLMRDRMILAPADAVDLSGEEAAALCEALNRQFPAMSFTACQPSRWCVRFADTTDIENPLDLAGREVAPPRNAAPLLTEAQMVLHAHPVNEAREARGEPAVNSLWLWGAGRATQARCAWQSVASDDPAVSGAARLAGARQRPLPRSARDWLERLPEDGRHLAVLDALRSQEPVHSRIEALERDWFGPLLAALRAGRVGMVTVHVPDGAEAVSFETIRADLRRFWRFPKSIEHYA